MSTYEERLDILADHIMDSFITNKLLRDACQYEIEQDYPSHRVAEICNVNIGASHKTRDDVVDHIIKRWKEFRRQEKERLSDVSYIDEDLD